MGDEYRKLSLIYLKDNIKVNKDALIIFSKVNNALIQCKDMFYGFDNNKLKMFYENTKDITSSIKEGFKNKAMKEIIVLGCLGSILNLIKSLTEENLVMNL